MRMDMIVLVALGQMEPDADAHESRGNEELQGQEIAQQHDGEQGPEERRRREIRSGSSRADMSKRQHEQDQADAIAEQADKTRRHHTTS